MRRHKHDTATYRELLSYHERVKSFTATMMNLVDYVRVQLELDVTSKWTRDVIIGKRVDELREAIRKIEAMRS